MNYLAHVFLSFEDEELLIGNFIADMISNQEVAKYSEGIKRGIYLHRKIDEYTDQHPEVLKGVRRLYKNHRKYAPVVIDVYYDYLLGNSWNAYSPRSLDLFTHDVYSILADHLSILPTHLQRNLPMMIEDNWLYEYKNVNGLQRAFCSMQKRASRPEWLDGALESLIINQAQLELEFQAFFPDIIQFVKNEIAHRAQV